MVDVLYFHQNPANHRFGGFLKAAIADCNPNIVRNSVAAGLGGTSPFGKRVLDRFGVGYFRYGLNFNLRNAVSSPPISLHINTETGAELFYNFAQQAGFI